MACQKRCMFGVGFIGIEAQIWLKAIMMMKQQKKNSISFFNRFLLKYRHSPRHNFCLKEALLHLKAIDDYYYFLLAVCH